jgi:serine/threonine-protein kinase
MEADHYARVKALFNAICDLNDAAREAALAAADARIAAPVRVLLEHEQATTRHVQRPVVSLLASLRDDDCKPGDVLGAWTLIERIGHGGMGSVYRARRSDGHFEQLAAIKVLRGIPSAEALAHLARERQILARLSHPHIARLLDGGATASGHPYLVMEYVDGQPLDVHARAQPLPARLRLLVTVCEAVSFAHQRLVIHCDIKPANILVASGRPLLLDFGIARLLGPDADTGNDDAHAFTPGYASPEQRVGGTLSTATDIYGLGVLLADLVGADLKSDVRAGTDSGSVAASSAPAQRIADAELRAIANRATADDPAQRYASVDAFAADVQRVLQREPVQALAGSRGYVARKYLQRHWPWLATAALFLLTVAGFTLRVVADRDRAEAAERQALQERDRAVQAQASSRQISEFLVSVFDGSHPDAVGGEIPTSTLVAQALARIDGELAGQPATQAELYATLAGVQLVLARHEDARANYGKAIAIQRALDQPLVLARQLIQRAEVAKRAFTKKEAEADAREALALVERHATADDIASRAPALLMLGTTLYEQGRHAEAEPLLLRALALEESRAPAGDGTAAVLSALGWHYQRKADYPAAERHITRLLALYVHSGRKDSKDYYEALDLLGSTYGLARRYDDAERALREALAGYRRLDGGDSADLAWRLSQLARVIDNAGRSIDAIPLYREAVAIGAKKMGTASTSYSVLLNNLAIASRRAGDFDTAEQSYAQALPAMQKDWPADDKTLNRIRHDYAMVLLQQGKTEAARAPLFETYAMRVKSLGENSNEATISQIGIADYELATRQTDHAWSRLQAIAERVLALEAIDQAGYYRVRGWVQARRGDTAAALADFGRAEALTREALGEANPRSWLAQLDRATLLASHAATRAESAALAAVLQQRLDAALVVQSPVRRELAELIALAPRPQ